MKLREWNEKFMLLTMSFLLNLHMLKHFSLFQTQTLKENVEKIEGNLTE